MSAALGVVGSIKDATNAGGGNSNASITRMLPAGSRVLSERSKIARGSHVPEKCGLARGMRRKSCTVPGLWYVWESKGKSDSCMVVRIFGCKGSDGNWGMPSGGAGGLRGGSRKVVSPCGESGDRPPRTVSTVSPPRGSLEFGNPLHASLNMGSRISGTRSDDLDSFLTSIASSSLVMSTAKTSSSSSRVLRYRGWSSSSRAQKAMVPSEWPTARMWPDGCIVSAVTDGRRGRRMSYKTCQQQ